MVFNYLKCLFKVSERYTDFEINVFFKNEILKIFETFGFEILDLKKNMKFLGL